MVDARIITMNLSHFLIFFQVVCSLLATQYADALS